MKGDFSRFPDERNSNFAGVLHQQGRVLLDADWNAQTAIATGWQDTAGQDIIGADVAAVPADQPDGFRIASATHAAGTTNVQLTVKPGRVWADGLLARLFGEPDPGSAAAVPRIATYLAPPIQDPPFGTASIAQGVRDAVVLEVWREELNGFQLPDRLIEPALGGPDTTERVNTAFAFRLMRLGPGDTCENITGRLKDDFSTKGKLKVSLQPAGAGGPVDCPTPAGGGYTGLEHNSYRIEIAAVDTGPPQFKWSQYGGGLVGRGHFDAAGPKVTIKANLQAITNSGLSSFYLEALARDPVLGHWRVTYGAPATLSNDVLTLGAKLFGTIPANPGATDTTFFRLWNGVALVQNFGNMALPNNVGIILAFDAPTASNYVPGDYWTFSVRAGEVVNPDVLIDTEPPKGIHYHRVPLAVVTWANAQDVQLPIEDCRHRFQPLTRLQGCCSYRVGDGMHSWGDFDNIQDAVDSLPAEGGEVCLLPGVYRENVMIDVRRNITIKGCGPRSRVVSPAVPVGAAAAPVFHVYESQNIRIISLAVEADTGVGILLEGRPLEVITKLQNGQPPLLNVTLEGLLIRAATRSAIEARVCYFTTIRRCRIEMKDVATSFHAVFFIGEDGLIENNVIVVPNEDKEIAGFEVVSPLDATTMGKAEAALGGLQLGGTCERIRVANNLIARGIGQGIVIGSLVTVSVDTEQPVPPPPPVPDPCFPCRPGDTSVPEPGDVTTRTSSEDDLYDIQIVRNRIWNMGLDGIGVVGFFPLGAVDEFISVHDLLIDRNEIRQCLNRPLGDIPEPMLNAMGYGGIALADVDNLVVRDNFITDNGPDFREPVCGIFVLHGEGIEISRNHILNNGARSTDSPETANSVKRGPRGGINVLFAVAPLVPISILGQIVPTQSGFPALMVHDNIVSVPLGRALSALALGPVSVVGNEFTSRGTSLRDVQTFIASTVLIVNLGLSNEFYLQLLAFSLLQGGNLTSVGEGRPGLDDQQLGKSLVNGNVLFVDNQCSLDLMEAGLSLALSSLAILSLDDVGFHNNQCDCNLFDDRVITQALLFGLSLRVSDNRFKEGIQHAAFSAATVGLFNTTTDNQSTHCLYIKGLPNLTVDHSNVSLVMLNNPRACCELLVHREECSRKVPDVQATAGSPDWVVVEPS
jgi:hypothetical protein